MGNIDLCDLLDNARDAEGAKGDGPIFAPEHVGWVLAPTLRARLFRVRASTHPTDAARKLGQSPRRGVTLIELLVVISILMLIAAVAVPAMRPALEGRRIREAARAINVYFGVAQGEAMRSGRPCGVILQRVEGLPQCAMVLQQALVPPPYAGDELSSAVLSMIEFDRSNNIVKIRAELRGGFNPALVHVGDRFQINAQGPWYTVIGPDANPADGIIDNTVGLGGDPLELRLDLSGGGMHPWTGQLSMPLPYQIIRRPIKSSAKPLQLPAGAVVDLVASAHAPNREDLVGVAPPLLRGLWRHCPC
ncbi:hypothetical protein LCGC14_2714580 [marine sediment metagenome]|uniref:General secretion pathway GspH domain-containing protein n=1 Tax=marine sediment metagenome TaxID=412755 RepID=A0A0F8ZBX7_9ZZZZ